MSEASAFYKGFPASIAGEQQKDSTLSIVFKFMAAHVKPKPSDTAKIISKVVRRYIQKFDQLTLKYSVLHHLYITNNEEYLLLALLQLYNTAVLQKSHDDYDHQGMDLNLSSG